MTDSKQFHDFIKLNFLHSALLDRAALPVAQVATHRKMREKAGLLKNVTDGPLVRIQKFTGGGVLPHLTANRESARQAIEPSHAAQDSGLTTSRRSEQGGNAPHRCLESHIELEAPKQPDVPSADRRCG